MSMEQKEDDYATPKLSANPNKGPIINLPKRWQVLKRLPWLIGQQIPFKSEWCDFCEGWELYFMNRGDKYPICPESVMICPCGCGKEFHYDKVEQERLRKQRGKSRGY